MTSPSRARDVVARAASASGAALVAVLLPKCPVCVAAYLAAIGLGAGAAQAAAPFVRPLAFALAASAALGLALGLYALARRRASPPCCPK